MKITTFRIASSAFAVVLATFSQAATIRVDHQSTTNGPGTSGWSNAFTNFQDALVYAADTENEVDQIWVADGTYLPTQRTNINDPRSVTFAMIDEVIIYGGFQGLSRSGGGETSLNQRNPEMYETILSGNIGDPGEIDDNAYHVVTANGVTESSRLNGFTVRDGYADGTGAHASGGGLWVHEYATPMLIRCRFTFNFAAGSGGAVKIDAPAFQDDVDRLFILACTFDYNESGNRGGALAVTGYSNVLLENCLGYANETGNQGGAFAYADCALFVMRGCTVSMNSTESEDLGAVHMEHGAGCGNTGIENCILYWNSNSIGQTEFAQMSFADEHISAEHCDIQGLSYYSIGIGNIDVDPGFVSHTTPYNFRLSYDSPLVNRGDSTNVASDGEDIDDDSITSEPLPDRDMASRQVNPSTCVDIGAFENQVTSNCTGDISGLSGTPDGEINVHDLTFVLLSWDQPGGIADLAGGTCGDGLVDGGDLMAIFNNWGDC